MCAESRLLMTLRNNSVHTWIPKTSKSLVLSFSKCLVKFIFITIKLKSLFKFVVQFLYKLFAEFKPNVNLEHKPSYWDLHNIISVFESTLSIHNCWLYSLVCNLKILTDDNQYKYLDTYTMSSQPDKIRLSINGVKDHTNSSCKINQCRIIWKECMLPE